MITTIFFALCAMFIGYCIGVSRCDVPSYNQGFRDGKRKGYMRGQEDLMHDLYMSNMADEIVAE